MRDPSIDPSDFSLQTSALLGKRFLFALWLLLLLPLLAFIGGPCITRTQEARVLETAREILDRPAGLDSWLIPKLNGEDRLRKPPLAYWASALAFLVGGVDDGIGRVPSTVCFWLTIGVTFLLAERLLGRRVAFLSAAVLATCYLPFRHARLAETDTQVTLFVTAAVYCFQRAAEDRRIRWSYVAGLCIGLGFNVKGLPGLFPMLVLIGQSAVMRRRDVPRRFVLCGALPLAIALGGAWYVYAAGVKGPAQFWKELRELGTGEDHAASVFIYFPYLLLASAPWSGMALVGAIGAIRRWRTDPALRLPLLWAGLVLLALLAAPNRQPHYLLPLMPAVAILAGWAIDVAIGNSSSSTRPSDFVARHALYATLGVIAVGGLFGIPVAERMMTGKISSQGWITGGVIFGLTLMSITIWVRRLVMSPQVDTGVPPVPRAIEPELVAISQSSALPISAHGRDARVTPAIFAQQLALSTAVQVALISLVLALPLATGFWYPSIAGEESRQAAAVVRSFSPGGPYIFYGSGVSLPLVFYLHQPIPLAINQNQLEARLRANRESPSGRRAFSLIVYREDDDPPMPVPTQLGGYSLRRLGGERVRRHEVEVYQVESAD